MSFQLVPKLVTLNGIMALILLYFTEFGSSGVHCVKVVEGVVVKKVYVHYLISWRVSCSCFLCKWSSNQTDFFSS